MDVRPLTDGLHVSPQIAVADLKVLAASGYRAVISNRPDGEESGQPSAAEIGDAAREAVLEFRHLPVTVPTMTEADAAAFGVALAELPGPVLGFCRSGTRTTMLWALSQAGVRPTDEIVAAGAAAGYDLEALRPRLDHPG